MVTKSRWYWSAVIALMFVTAFVGYLAWQKRAGGGAADAAQNADNVARPLPPPSQVVDAGSMLPPVTPTPVTTTTPCGETQRRTLERSTLRLGAGQPFFMATLCGGEHLLEVMLSQGAVREDGSPAIVPLVRVDGQVRGTAARIVEAQFFLHNWEQFGPYPTLFETSRLSDFGSIAVGQLFVTYFQEQACTTRLQYRSTTPGGRERLAGFTASLSGCWLRPAR